MCVVRGVGRVPLTLHTYPPALVLGIGCGCDEFARKMIGRVRVLRAETQAGHANLSRHTFVCLRSSLSDMSALVGSSVCESACLRVSRIFSAVARQGDDSSIGCGFLESSRSVTRLVGLLLRWRLHSFVSLTCMKIHSCRPSEPVTQHEPSLRSQIYSRLHRVNSSR